MESMPDLSFPSEERLKHKKLFEELFSSGKRAFKHPVLAVWSEVTLPNEGAVQVGFVAPKKHYKSAVERNRVKRLMREAYRHQKHTFIEEVKQRGKQIAILLICVKSDNISYEALQPKILLLLQEIGRTQHGR